MRRACFAVIAFLSRVFSYPKFSFIDDPLRILLILKSTIRSYESIHSIHPLRHHGWGYCLFAHSEETIGGNEVG